MIKQVIFLLEIGRQDLHSLEGEVQEREIVRQEHEAKIETLTICVDEQQEQIAQLQAAVDAADMKLKMTIEAHEEIMKSVEAEHAQGIAALQASEAALLEKQLRVMTQDQAI